VQFALAQDCVKAIKELGKKRFGGGRTLKLEIAIKKSIVKECKFLEYLKVV
jgi:hypothetical protein